jgi:hypothetical protein
METSKIEWIPLNGSGEFVKLLEAIPIVNGRFVEPSLEMVPSWKAWVQQYTPVVDKAKYSQNREIFDSIPGRDDAYCLEKLTAWSAGQFNHRLDRWESFAPARYRDCTLDNYKISEDDSEHAKRQEAVLGRVRRFAEKLPEHIENGVNIVFYGPPGTGKTHVLAALLRDAVVNVGCLATWKTGAEINRESDPRTKDYSDRKPITGSRYNPLDDIFERMTDRNRILAIDDPALPGQPLAFYTLTAVTSMVDDAYQCRWPVWITINATNQNQIVELISGPVADRLKDGALTAFFDWPSYRRKGEF